MAGNADGTAEAVREEVRARYAAAAEAVVDGQAGCCGPTPTSVGLTIAATGNRCEGVSSRAAVLRGLHRPGDPLLLPNVWDCQSARLVAAAGSPAVATSSAAVADSLGYLDGEATPVGEMLDAITRIAAAVPLPVTADLERGYRMGPAELVERLVATGTVGCNLEDSDPSTGTLIDAERQAEFLADIHSTAVRSGVDLVINARIDTYLRVWSGEPGARLSETIRRAQLYHAAGADCVYPILMTNETAIAEFVGAVKMPVNLLADFASEPSAARLVELGAARISYGPRLYRATKAHLAGLIAEIFHSGEGESSSAR